MKKAEESVKVAVRCRPMNSTEKGNNCSEVIKVDEERGEIFVTDPTDPGSKPRLYTFDHSFGTSSQQVNIFKLCTMPILESVIEGYNGTIFAYGQTGTGKTFTMEGVVKDENLMGMTPRTFRYIFE